MADEKIVVGKGTRYPLDGILSVPERSTIPFPAVVLVHGSGPGDMNAKIGANYFFKDIAEKLSEGGVASIRYNKRTFVYAKEMRKDKAITVKEETIDDAILAADLLRNDPRIDKNKIFIIGHSLGGMLAPRIDAEGGHFKGIILMNGSPRKLEEIIMYQNDLVLNGLGSLLKKIAARQITALSKKFNAINTLNDEEAKEKIVLGKYTSAYYLKEMGEHPSINYLEKLNKPILVLQGDRDLHTSLEKDFNKYKEILENKSNATYKLYPNLNHLFMPAIYDKILKLKKEYKIPQHVDKQVTNDIVNWIFSVAN